MSAVLIYHVIGDLTVGKPAVAEFSEAETVESAIRAIGECAEGAIPVWRRQTVVKEDERRAARFVGMLNALDLVAFLARAGAGGDREAAMRAPVSDVVVPNPGLLKEVDPGTRLIDALEMMKQGVRRLLVRKSVAWMGMSKRFSILFNGKWLKKIETSSSTSSASSGSQPSSSCLSDNKYCCLSREDVVRFLIGRLGTLAPIPLSSISTLGAITPHYSHVEASSPALEAVQKSPQDPYAIAVTETNSDGTIKIIGEISAYKLWKCNFLAASWAMANLSAGQFVLGAEENGTAHDSLPHFATSPVEDTVVGADYSRTRKFSSKSIGFFDNHMAVGGLRSLRSMYRGRSPPLTCKHTSSLAAVMAQMLSHRATHVWVTKADAEEDDILVGVVSYSDILSAVIKHPGSMSPLSP